MKKNGTRNGIQTYKCHDCGRQFRFKETIPDEELWHLYCGQKQTVKELSEYYGLSESTIKRRLSHIRKEWVQPALSGSGYVHMDATYWGRNCGILVALDSETGKVLYLEFIRHERISDYVNAVKSIEDRGYKIKGIIIDGIRSLFDQFSSYKIQMCQFHMRSITRRYLTNKPKLKASRALLELMGTLASSDKDTFGAAFASWKKDWGEFLNRRSTSKRTGKSHYTHKKLRTATNSIEFYLPYLFTYQDKGCEGMPNTNNKIEGTFTDLKKNLNNHSGMCEENRKRFICGFFLGLE